jgi:hypothetical protein
LESFKNYTLSKIGEREIGRRERKSEIRKGVEK